MMASGVRRMCMYVYVLFSTRLDETLWCLRSALVYVLDVCI